MAQAAKEINQDPRGCFVLEWHLQIWFGGGLLTKVVPSCAPAVLTQFSAGGPPAVSGSPQRCLSEPCQRETSDTSLGTWLLSPEGPPVGEITTATGTFIAFSP